MPNPTKNLQLKNQFTKKLFLFVYVKIYRSILDCNSYLLHGISFPRIVNKNKVII